MPREPLIKGLVMVAKLQTIPGPCCCKQQRLRPQTVPLPQMRQPNIYVASLQNFRTSQRGYKRLEFSRSICYFFKGDACRFKAIIYWRVGLQEVATRKMINNQVDLMEGTSSCSSKFKYCETYWSSSDQILVLLLDFTSNQKLPSQTTLPAMSFFAFSLQIILSLLLRRVLLNLCSWALEICRRVEPLMDLLVKQFLIRSGFPFCFSSSSQFWGWRNLLHFYSSIKILSEFISTILIKLY